MNAEALSSALRHLGPLSSEAFAGLRESAISYSFRPGDLLLEGGEPAERVHVVARGLVREYYLAEGGTEHTRAFVREGQVTGSLLDLLSGVPSVTWIQALEQTETIGWRYAELDSLCSAHPSLQRAARRAAEGLYVRKAWREYEMLALSASERYARWCATHADLDPRVKRRHLASYLGVTAEHLSRLRRPRQRGE